MPISLSGLGSGLDIQSLVTQLVASEGQAKSANIDRREESYQTQLSALGKLKSALGNFKAAAEALANSSELTNLEASVSDETVLSTEANSLASGGSYSVDVQNLAVAHKLSSQAYTNAETSVGSGGALTITSGTNSFTITVVADPDPSIDTSSLSSIRDAINSSQENQSVTASIINVDDGSGGKESRLILTARETGLVNAITVSANDSDGDSTDTSGLSALAYDIASNAANLVEIVPAEDSLVRIDDAFVISNSSNTVSDAITGVTLELKSEGLSSLNVSVDTETTKESFQEFVDSYNALISTYKSLSSYDESTNTAGPLSGDFTIRSIIDNTKSIIRTNDVALEFQNLFSVGIELTKDGSMIIDNAKLSASLTRNPKAISDLVSGETGIAGRLDSLLGTKVELGGTLDLKTKALNASITDINAEREALDLRLSTLEKSLLDQFIAMDILVAQYNSTGSYLASQISALPGYSNK